MKIQKKLKIFFFFFGGGVGRVGGVGLGGVRVDGNGELKLLCKFKKKKYFFWGGGGPVGLGGGSRAGGSG